MNLVSWKKGLFYGSLHEPIACLQAEETQQETCTKFEKISDMAKHGECLVGSSFLCQFKSVF